ncbi:hypothetical protein INP83_11895 [Mucilaginibacter sp. 21P]|uniref:hypothetical protein n=1 Tax=Mucilaginibacter sp. 21P TaxID=2778902 RepID=UPI001C55FDC2|nr:hypothetical protein [Mucilaginibacter sp. 21P]QXV63808.1 hypothetical protein INP83_11895 [Mucilaginibacter sp. 21P]
MKRLVLILIMVCSRIVFAQTPTYFNSSEFAKEVLKYKPMMRAGVTEKRFAYAQRILEETRSSVKNDPTRLNAADLWNITTAFVVLKEPRQNIELAFTRAIQADPRAICEYIKSIGNNGLDTLIPEKYLEFYRSCPQFTGSISDANTKDAEVSRPGDESLVSLLEAIRSDDQRYRRSKNVDWSKQRPLDLKNQKRIDSLYQDKGTYIGRKLAGKDHETIMWLVIQHSNIEMMQRYLPVVWLAVKEAQLDEAPFTMLLDRICTIKYGYQIFGSQADVPVAKKEIRDKIVEQYKVIK